MKSCIQDISKSITAMSLKLSQQIISRLAGENLKKSFFLSYCPLKIWTLKAWYLKNITARSFRLR